MILHCLDCETVLHAGSSLCEPCSDGHLTRLQAHLEEEKERERSLQEKEHGEDWEEKQAELRREKEAALEALQQDHRGSVAAQQAAVEDEAAQARRTMEQNIARLKASNPPPLESSPPATATSPEVPVEEEAGSGMSPLQAAYHDYVDEPGVGAEIRKVPLLRSGTSGLSLGQAWRD